MGGAGGNLGGTLAAVGRGAPVVSPRPASEPAEGRPLSGWVAGGFWGRDSAGMIIYGRPVPGAGGLSWCRRPGAG